SSSSSFSFSSASSETACNRGRGRFQTPAEPECCFMIAALVYLQVHSIKNRLWVRLRRLKKPKYLAGAIVGGRYFYFYFYRWLFLGGGGAQKISGAASAETMALYESIGSVALFVIVLLSWILPRERAALAFTEAEVAFLF